MIKLYKFDFSAEMEKGVDIKNITGIVAEAVTKANVKYGVVHVTSIGSTGSVTTIEYEPGVVNSYLIF